jgi:hypothetical protein
MMPAILSHNVPALLEAAKTSLADLVMLYLATEVACQSQATLAFLKHLWGQRFTQASEEIRVHGGEFGERTL